jgi:2-C-methyl-D-erythritol 4-phosphate cytidylyltransferase / 2-C-methyl-D-erythritol 2,4-cyclodiphosphate synthase
MNTLGISVIIPAAGDGRRFRESVPRTKAKLPVQTNRSKVCLPLGHTPILTRVLQAFDGDSNVREIIIAIKPGGARAFRDEVLNGQRFKKPIYFVSGGKTRAESVWRGLKRVSSRSQYVCVHDAARPLVRPEWLRELAKRIDGCDGVVLGRAVVPTIKRMNKSRDETLDRNQLFEAQTPQLLRKDSLTQAYRRLGANAWQATDDASILEAAGGRVKVWIHAGHNPKITTYADWLMLQKLESDISGRNQNSDACQQNQCLSLRFGLGFDRHRLVPKRAFYLAGVRVPSPVGPLGHSDGDPLLHAVTDGILGACGAGDMGDFFPDTRSKWKNARSALFLKQAVALAKQKGVFPAQVDATIFLERPKLGALKKKIQGQLAKLLSLPTDQVNVKAKTAEGLGPEGEGLAVACQALVVLKKS